MRTIHPRVVKALLGGSVLALLLPSACLTDGHGLGQAPDPGGQGGALAKDAGAGGAGGGFSLRVPDGGFRLDALGGLLDALGNSPLSRLVCGKDVQSGAACTPAEAGISACVLSNLRGICNCTPLLGRGFWVCPTLTSGDGGAALPSCPSGAATGGPCPTPLATCLGGGAVACLCGLGTYTCL
jgi:hypothetical protein